MEKRICAAGSGQVMMTTTRRLTYETHTNSVGSYRCQTTCLSDHITGTPYSTIVTPRIRCARCLSVIRRCCHVICLRVAFYHVIMCISFCIRVRLMHPSLFPVVRFAIRHSYVLRRPPLLSFREWVLNFLGMARGLPSGLGIAPVDRLSSFVPFGGRLVLQRLTG